MIILFKDSLNLDLSNNYIQMDLWDIQNIEWKDLFVFIFLGKKFIYDIERKSRRLLMVILRVVSNFYNLWCKYKHLLKAYKNIDN